MTGSVELKLLCRSFAFEIVQPNKSFFNFSGTPDRFPFLANSQDEMVDWMVGERHMHAAL